MTPVGLTQPSARCFSVCAARRAVNICAWRPSWKKKRGRRPGCPSRRPNSAASRREGRDVVPAPEPGSAWCARRRHEGECVHAPACCRKTPHDTSGRSSSHRTACPAARVASSTFGQCSAGNGRSVWNHGATFRRSVYPRSAAKAACPPRTVAARRSAAFCRDLSSIPAV